MLMNATVPLVGMLFHYSASRQKYKYLLNPFIEVDAVRWFGKTLGSTLRRVSTEMATVHSFHYHADSLFSSPIIAKATHILQRNELPFRPPVIVLSSMFTAFGCPYLSPRIVTVGTHPE